MNTCAVLTCGRPLPTDEQRTACARCEHRIRSWLREIPHQLRLLHASLEHDRGGPKQGSIHGGRAHAPLPLRGDVLTLLGPGSTAVTDPHGDQSGPLPVTTFLHSWAEATADHISPQATPAIRPGGTWSAWLTAYLPWALTAEWVGSFHDELGELTRHLRGITHTEPRSRPLAAPCPGADCHAFGLLETDWADYIECTVCGRLLTRAEYDEHAARTLPPLHRLAILIAANTPENHP